MRDFKKHRVDEHVLLFVFHRVETANFYIKMDDESSPKVRPQHPDGLQV